MAIDITRLKQENQKSIESLDNSLARLNALMNEGLPLSEAVAVNAQINRVQGDKIHFQIVRGHLHAANTIVKEMSAERQARLDELSSRLDDAIREDFVINATFGVVKRVISAAEELTDITSSHITT
jgi:hypothetical protein